jgi:hypothetical protein
MILDIDNDEARTLYEALECYKTIVSKNKPYYVEDPKKQDRNKIIINTCNRLIKKIPRL